MTSGYRDCARILIGIVRSRPFHKKLFGGAAPKDLLQHRHRVVPSNLRSQRPNIFLAISPREGVRLDRNLVAGANKPAARSVDDARPQQQRKSQYANLYLECANTNPRRPRQFGSGYQILRALLVSLDELQ